jgi:hypothetical protein
MLTATVTATGTDHHARTDAGSSSGEGAAEVFHQQQQVRRVGRARLELLYKYQEAARLTPSRAHALPSTALRVRPTTPAASNGSGDSRSQRPLKAHHAGEPPSMYSDIRRTVDGDGDDNPGAHSSLPAQPEGVQLRIVAPAILYYFGGSLLQFA